MISPILIYIVVALLGAAFGAPLDHGGGDDLPALCQNGTYVTELCCVQQKERWFTGLVPLDDVDYIQVMPYTCANPSFCAVMQYSQQPPKPKSGSMFLDGARAAADYSGGNRFYSGAQYSCGALDFILCKHLGDRAWQCYAKAVRSDITVKFTQELKCEYHTLPNGTVALWVGSCVINQQTVLMQGPFDRTYADLSTNETLSFVPILNPGAADALRRQTGINRVVRRSDVVVMPAYMPLPYSDRMSADEMLELLGTLAAERHSLTVLACFFVLAIFLFLGVVAFILCAIVLLWKRTAPAPAAHSPQEEAEHDGTEMAPAQQVYPSPMPVQLDFFNVEEKLQVL